MAPRKGRNLSDDRQFSVVVDQLSGGYKTIGQMVYAVLREAILSGAFAPGEWLRQESLAEAIGVSRIPVRTALLQLESEGMITFHPHRGARVRTLTVEQIDEIYRLRTLLESYALTRGAAVIEPERLALLQSLAKKLDKQAQGSEFLELRIRFYRELYDAENNALLVDMIDDLRSHVGRYYLGIKFGDRHRHHTELVERLAANDMDGAQKWLTSHFEQIRNGIQELAVEDDSNGTGDDTADPAAANGKQRHGDGPLIRRAELPGKASGNSVAKASGKSVAKAPGKAAGAIAGPAADAAADAKRAKATTTTRPGRRTATRPVTTTGRRPAGG
jgi:DNA-binding GntR family transcriptional regulator